MTFRVIPFTRYHGGENESGDPEGVREVYSSDYHATFDEVGLPEDWRRIIYSHRIGQNWGELVGEWPTYELMAESEPDVMIYSYWIGKEEEAYAKFCFWLAKVVNESSSVGGDDSYFDYYPDQFHVADQIARSMTPMWEAAVQEAKKKVYDNGLYHDEDAIGHGLPLEEGQVGAKR